MTDAERAIRQRLKDDLEHYSAKCLKIRTKAGATLPLVFNRAQQFIHGKLEVQRQAKGFVRALVLKGRQQGCSTYVGARFYHRVTHSKGLRVFILTHEDPATQNLFDMVSRYHDNCPAPVRPRTGASNAKELMFPLLDSGYKVGTAGSQGVGRSATIQLLHGSEVAFWKFAEAHAAGILQTVPEESGTEVILESTANGLGNFFHQKWRDAESGIGDFIPIFVPWFWQSEYSRPVDKTFILTDEEVEYAELHDVTREQIAWRRNKIAELKDPTLFKQEYPATAQEAFQTTGHDSFIKPEDIVRARKAKCEAYGPLIMGVDPARFGDDRFSIAYRQGRKLVAVDSDTKIDVVAAANWVKREIDANRPDRCFIDVGGLGAGVYDILQSWGNPYARICVAVNFGGEPMEPVEILSDGSKKAGPRNRRAEMWKRSRDWLNEPGGADIPDSDSLHADACAPGYHYDLNQRLLIESKEHMRARNVSSPDEWDAVCFVAGTMIATPAGEVAIEDVTVGDFVLTPFGDARVVKKWETETERLTRVGFSDGSVLEGRPEHEIFVFGRGMVRLDALALTMAVSPWNQRDKWIRLSGLFTRERLTGFKKAAGILPPAIQSSVSVFCIGAYGLNIVGQFQMGMRSIIATMIGAIRLLITWSACRKPSIGLSIQAIAPSGGNLLSSLAAICTLRESELKNGINRARAASGIESMQSLNGKVASRLRPFANTAHQNTSRFIPSDHVSVLAHVSNPSRIAAILTKLANVRAAARSLLRTATARRRVVPVSVQTVSVPPTPVFNLTLDRDNAYYANGVLAFNCLTFAEPVTDMQLHYADDGFNISDFDRSPVTGY